MLNVTVEESGKNVILRCVGQIVRGYETALLCAALGHSEDNVVVDLSQVDALDATGVGAFIALQAAGVYLQMLNPAKAIADILRFTGLDSICEIFSSSATTEPDGEQSSAVLLLPAMTIAT